MTEKQTINGKDVWLIVEPYYTHRDNPNVIPTEYFTVSYYLSELAEAAEKRELIKDDNGDVKLFESPVAAISFAEKRLESVL